MKKILIICLSVLIMSVFSGCEALEKSAVLQNPLSVAIFICIIGVAVGSLTAMFRLKKKFKKEQEKEKNKK